MGNGAVLHSMFHGIPPIQEPMARTRSEKKRYQEALISDNLRDVEELAAQGLGLEMRMNFSWRSNTAVPRVVKECPAFRSRYLGELLKRTLSEDPDQRPTIEELLKVVLRHERRIRELSYSAFPTWFQLASRSSLAEAQRAFTKPVPPTPLPDPMIITHG